MINVLSMISRVFVQGDSLLDEEDYTERKRKAAKRKRKSHDQSNKSDSSIKSHDNASTTGISSRKLKKKRKKLTSAAVEQNGKSVSAEKNIQSEGKSNNLHGKQKHLQQLRNELGLPGGTAVTLNPEKEHEHSAAQSVISVKIKGPDVVLFQEPGRGKKQVVINLICVLIIQLQFTL